MQHVAVADETPLPRGRGGGSAWRSGPTVHRTVGPWTETVHAFLHHLEAEGFEGAPRVLGYDDQGREVLTFLEGEVLADPNWQPGEPERWPPYAQSEEALAGMARLLRRFHAAATSFRPSSPVWKQWDWSELLRGDVVCHGDIGRHNTVYRGGVPVALIDWDSIRPNNPLVEFGVAAWNYVPLGTDQYFASSGFERRPDLTRRLAIFAREYGVVDRDAVGWAVQQGKQRSVEAMRYWPITPVDASRFLDIVAADLAWLARELDRLLESL